MTNRLCCVVIFLILSAWYCFADTAACAPGSEPASLTAQASSTGAGSQDRSATSQHAAEQTIPVQLARSLDSRKLKQGDAVETRTTAELRMADGTIIPQGSKVMGHVTAATARSKGDAESSLGITFDQIELRDGRTIPLKADIQALGPPPNLGPAASQMGNPAPMPGAGMPGGIGNPPNSGGLGAPPSNFPTHPSGGTQPGAQGNTQSPDVLTPESTGVMGFHDLQLEQNSTLTSRGKQVKVEGGSQILLRVQNQ